MGRVASELADLVIVTSDNPRSEDPAVIIDAIVGGAVEVGGAELEVIADRADAISRAVVRAEAGDVVLVAGKGHEQGQQLADGLVIEFDDATVLRAALEASAK